MSQRKSRQKQTSKARASKPPKEVPAIPPGAEADFEAPPEIPNGVMIVVNDQGGREITPLGQTKPTELPTLLRIAANDVERQLGIGH